MLSKKITFKEISSLLKPRVQDSHKGSYGHVMIIACSKGKIGAGILAAQGALRAGAGLSTLILPADAFKRVDPEALEIMYEPVQGGFFTEKHLKKVLRLVKKSSVVALGPGLGTQKSTVKFVQEFIQCYHGPLIIDADGLNAMAGKKIKRKGLTLLTPHPGEMGRLIGKTAKFVQENRLKVAKDFAVKNKVHLLLKGYRSIVAFPNGEIWINPTGNPAMAQGGQGDALTGIFAGLISEFGWKKHALLAAPFFHGLVGDQLAKKKRIVLASDILKNLKWKQ